MLYKTVVFFIRIALRFFYKSIKTTYTTTIPIDKPVLYVANHPNAMLDPLLIAVTVPKPIYFLARASAFKRKIAAYFLKQLHAIAIYRIRDGVDSKKKNEAVFKHSLALLSENKQLLIFPEGGHSIRRQIHPLKLGFTRITLDFIKNNPTTAFYIVPVGLNYTNTLYFGEEVHVIYGKPILANSLVVLNNELQTKQNLVKKVSTALEEITVHIPADNYDYFYNKIPEKAYLNPVKTTDAIKNNTLQEISKTQKNKNIFYRLMQLNSVFPFLIWAIIKPKIKEVEFLTTFKFTLGITVFPFFYLLQSSLIYSFFGAFYTLLYFLISILLVYLAKN